MNTNTAVQASGTTHDWYPLEVTDDQPEQIYWCHHCDATKDSSGSIIP